MKKLLSMMLLTLVGMTAMAQKEIVWQNPSAFMGNYNSEFKITKVELKPTETVLHIIVPDSLSRHENFYLINIFFKSRHIRYFFSLCFCKSRHFRQNLQVFFSKSRHIHLFS